jgi:ArsR family transcriptional regulator, arsenate/arsenite/antimonite-responsive transcriptional repressor
MGDMAPVASPPRTNLTLAAAAGCSPVTGGILGPDEAQRLAHVLKAVADPMRLRLLSLVGAHDDGEACVCDLSA